MIYDSKAIDGRQPRAAALERSFPPGPVDTSKLGPIRITPLPAMSRARALYADKVAAMGPAYRNAAESIRGGFENVWIRAGILAAADALRRVPDDDD